MKKYILGLAALLFSFGSFAQDSKKDSDVIRDIYSYSLSKQNGYKWLGDLCAKGGRLAGSEEATNAVFYFKQIGDSLGFETSVQKVKVPFWKRNEDSKVVLKRAEGDTILASTALGGCVSTNKKGIDGKIIEITHFRQLDSLENEIKGNIVFYNIPMDPKFINPFFAYSTAVNQRWAGALEASKRGAKGVLIRSLSSSVNDYPHTGSMTYRGAPNKIPSVALSTVAADYLSEYLQEQDAEAKLNTYGEWQDSAYSYNLVMDLKGTSIPEEYILLSGHIDSWDLGTGAHDDGAGCMHSLDAAYMLKDLGLMTKRSIRVVFFMNEEFGLNGARAYADSAQKLNVNHYLALESDAGGFSPRGFSVNANDSTTAEVKSLRSLFEPYGLYTFRQGGGGADISKIKQENLLKIGLSVDGQRYFEVHHSARDIYENVNARELQMGAASIASLIYLLDKYDIH